ncbi:proteophosphoglycan ppg4 [Moniliophthora roreri MCA 2997]|uniref:Proteophosphoglycan ppg4 n=2 Tax=Moniliophthora roreri TaxID=221103 RepID=V2XVB8_MONRO|nr:proteophosphoglycan ppg4 [Moniliophthora roreri MCA 2997]KAI3619768.1 proteophosphoglycan ppg4 [Moniliophthora roreri]
MVRNLAAKHELPANPTFKEFERSDGDPSTWPTNTDRIIDSDGHVNYMQHLDVDHSLAIKWRVGTGEALAKALKWPEGPSYVLKDWPAGYRMFDHNKGPAEGPRHDVYLFGPKSLPKFRSVPEFIPHAIWLFSDPTMNNANCECKYCTKKSQREITATMRSSSILPPAPSMSPGASSMPPSRRFQKPRPEASTHGVYAAVQKAAPKPRSKSSHIVPNVPMVAERNLDLRAVHSHSSCSTRNLKRWCRTDEIVWCGVQPPLKGPQGDYDTIHFWPAIVKEHNLKVDTQNTSRLSHYNPDAPPWEVTQSTTYRVKLLAISCEWNVADDEVLPYQAYSPPEAVFEAMREVARKGINWDRDYIAKFTPCPARRNFDPNPSSPQPPTFAQAVAPLATAIQIASQITHFWGLTDNWDFKFAVPQPSPSTSSSISAIRTRPMSLQDAISEASSSNAAVMSSSQGTKQVTSRVLGEQYNVPHTVVTQQRFQGLWWGAERIWTGDFVRLKLPRKALAPNGAPHILLPSTAGEATIREFRDKYGIENAEEMLGASSRGIIMRLDALSLVDVSMTVEGGGTRIKKECRAHGALYEVACQDWEEPFQDRKSILNDHETGISTSTPSEPMTFGAPDPLLLQSSGAGEGEGDTTTFQTFLQPSPLQPPALPNPDPAVPIEATTLNLLRRQGVEASGTSRPSKPQSQGLPASPSIDQLSRPAASAAYNMPAPPEGYKFRPILEDGYEAVFSLTMISGRYFPGILSHPKLGDLRDEGPSEIRLPHGDGVGVNDRKMFWALEGLEPGCENSTDPVNYKKDRMKMIEDADKAARSAMEDGFGPRKVEEGMEVDELALDDPDTNAMQVDAS